MYNDTTVHLDKHDSIPEVGADLLSAMARALWIMIDGSWVQVTPSVIFISILTASPLPVS